jgi:hypothetical protein
MPAMKDLTGQRFGKLVAIKQEGRSKSGQIICKCHCDCGNEVFVKSRNLTKGGTRSCGCVDRKRGGARLRDITGQRFGRLVAVKRISHEAGKSLWECRCDCGNTIVVLLGNLTAGTTKSCGCLLYERIREKGTKPGMLSSKPTAANTTGVRGVVYRKDTGKYSANIKLERKLYCLGTFATLEEAALARKRGEEKIWGSFLSAQESHVIEFGC